MLIALSLFLATAALVALWALWVRTRRKHLHVVVPGTVSPRTLAALTWGHVTEGNAVRIVQNSAFFDALIEDVVGAVTSVHLETFLWQDGVVSDRVTAALGKKAREGVAVRVLVDQRGAMQASPKTWAALRDAGCEFRVYHRTRLRELPWVNRRDHRKIAVIDGRIGYTFGHGIGDLWSGEGWRDTAARFEGPLVRDLQSAFLDNWMKVTRHAVADDRFFPDLPAAGTIAAHVAYVAPPETSSAVQRLYYLAIAAAREEVILQNPYFIPDHHAIELCAAAIRRGVAIKLMLPTAETSDFPIVQHASHYAYGPLLRAGARIWEYTRSGIHQKVLVVDRSWCTVGSTNFDPRSFHLNDEITVAIHDEAIARELARAFEDDLRHADEWTLPRWNERTMMHRVRDRVSAMFRRQL